MRTPSVPGVSDLVALPGRDAWRGRAGREPVDVVVVVVPPDPDLRRAALAALTPLVAEARGCVPRGRAAVTCRDGVALVADAVDGRRLADLPPLQLGHAVAAGSAVAQALAALHGHGLAWGGRLEELLVEAGGQVRLPFDAVAARRVAGRAASARDDVAALATLLTGCCPAPELAVLAADPGADAAALARRLRRISRPRPLLLAGGPRRGRVRHRASGHLRRSVLVAAGSAGALVVAAAAGWVSARPHDGGGGLATALVPMPPAAVTAVFPTAPAATDWAATMHALDEARVAAMTGRAPLAAVDAVGGPAYAQDATTRASLVARHLRVSPPVPALRAVAPSRVTATAATLAVTDTLAAYAYRDAAGRVVASAPARGAHTWTVVLVRTAAGWRITAVT